VARVWLLRAVLALITLLAPLKLGSVAVPGEVGYFPLSPWEALFGTWPPFFGAVFAGTALLLAVLVFPPPRLNWRFWLFPVAWLLLAAVSCLCGWIRTTERDAALLLSWHFGGIAAFGLAVFWVWSQDRGLAPWLLAALALGTLLSAGSGWMQVKGGGFDETLQYLQRAAQESGQPLPGEYVHRLSQRRAFGPFVYPNSFAAHLLLTSPLVLLLAWRAGRRFDPVRVSQPLFLGIAAVLTAGAFWFSGSRAGILAVGAGFALALLLQPVWGRWRWWFFVAGGIGALAVFGLMTRHRVLNSVGARFDYYRAAVTMVREQPLTGVGLGEFFPNYLRLKPPAAEETRLPHNMLLGMAAQCGIPGGAAAAVCLLLPFWLWWLALHGRLSGVDPWLIGVGEIGLFAWSIHALTDFNCEITGSMMIVAMLPLLLLPAAEPLPAPASPRSRIPAMAGRAAAAFLGLAGLLALTRVPGEYSYQRLTSLVRSPQVSFGQVWEMAGRAGQQLPWSPYPWMVLGRKADELAAPEIALQAYDEARRRAPHRAAFHLRAADCAWRLGDREKALAAFREAQIWYPHAKRNAEFARRLGREPDPAEQPPTPAPLP
jgi:hypothetical protein